MTYHNGPKIVTSGLVLHLDAANPKSYISGSSTCNDLSSLNTNFGVFNGTGYTDNPAKFVFDGVDDNLGITSVPSSLQLKDDKTITCWWKHYSVGGDAEASIIRVGLGTDLLYAVFSNNASSGNARKLSFHWYNGAFFTVASTTTFVLDTFNFGVVSVNGPTARFYINGILAGSGSVTTPSPVSAAQVGIGASRAGGVVGTTGQDLAGEISMIQVYNRALSADEILQNFNATRGRFRI